MLGKLPSVICQLSVIMSSLPGTHEGKETKQMRDQVVKTDISQIIPRGGLIMLACTRRAKKSMHGNRWGA